MLQNYELKTWMKGEARWRHRIIENKFTLIFSNYLNLKNASRENQPTSDWIKMILLRV
jgi:hypothetical protein